MSARTFLFGLESFLPLTGGHHCILLSRRGNSGASAQYLPRTRAVGASSGTLEDKKRVMDYSLMMACILINTIGQESRSALPDAPVVSVRRAGHTRRRLARLRGWLATVLHQAAWALEPDLP
jgi:hypothetical protein